MGRKIKIKTVKEKREYQKKRGEQNRVNQKNFRLRKKLLKNIQLSSSIQINKEYKETLKIYLKEIGFNTFLTLTTKRKRNKKHIKVLMDNFFKLLSGKISIERGFCVIEQTNDNPHIHILLKSNLPYRELIESIKSSWNEGFIHSVKIYSENENYTLENYLLKEVSYNSVEVNWWIL